MTKLQGQAEHAVSPFVRFNDVLINMAAQTLEKLQSNGWAPKSNGTNRSTWPEMPMNENSKPVYKPSNKKITFVYAKYW